MAEQLVCEGANPVRMLASLQRKYGSDACIVEQTPIRRGGVFGFFAQELYRITFELPDRPVELASAADDDGPANIDPSSVEMDEPGQLVDTNADLAPSFADLLAEIDAAESEVNLGINLDLTETGDQIGELVAELTQQPASDDVVEPDEPAITPPSPILRAVPSDERPSPRAKLDMLLQLRQVGVPVALGPGGDAHSVYQALDEILEELPSTPAPPRRPGDVLVIVGQLTPALRAATAVTGMLRMSEDEIYLAGTDSHPVSEQLSATGDRRRMIRNLKKAIKLRGELAGADSCSVIVVATDAVEADPDDPWIADMVAALRPTTVWATIDATSKVDDARAELSRLGGADAIAVYSARASQTPASVWDLDLPIALIDGRPASTFVWAGLLLGLIRPGARHRASA